MAYLNSTILNDLQGLQAFNEKRARKFGLINAAYNGRSGVDYLLPSAIQALSTTSSAKNYQLPMIKDQTVTVSTTPGFANIPINLGESANYYFTAYDVFSGFRFFPAVHANNQIDAETYRNNILSNVLEAMAATKEGILKTVADARKTQKLANTQQVSMGDGTFTFSESTDDLTINKAAQKDLMLPYLVQLMDSNLLSGDYSIVTSLGGLSVVNAESMKYAGNQSKDLSWSQMAVPMENRFESSVITTSANFDGYFIRNGALTFYPNFPYDFVNGTEIAGKKWSISDTELPFIKSQANIFINTEATDATSLVTPSDSNLIMTTWEEMAIWDRFYVVYRYNSDLANRANDIVKLVGATT